MSWDGFLACEEGREGVVHIADLLDQAPCFSRSDGDWAYFNPDTGVYFSMTTGVMRDDDWDAMAPDSAKALTPCLSININYLRPRFFGYEAALAIGPIAEACSLHFVDPQDGRVVDSAQTVVADAIDQSWTMNNHAAIRKWMELRREAPRGWRAESAMRWWQYQFRKHGLQAQLGEDVFVPTLALRAGEDGPRTAIVWSDAIPFVFPECDEVLVIRTRRRLVGKCREMGTCPAPEVRNRLKDALQTVETPAGRLEYLPPPAASRFNPEFNRLPITRLASPPDWSKPDAFRDEP